MKKLYLVCYFNEMESENDADVLVIDKTENHHKCFKKFFKKTYDYEINDKDILGIYPIDSVSSSDNSSYTIELKNTKGKKKRNNVKYPLKKYDCGENRF